MDVMLLKIHSAFSLPTEEKKEVLQRITKHCTSNKIKLSDPLDLIDSLGSRWEINELLSAALGD